MPQLPEAYLRQMNHQLGEQFPLFLSAMDLPPQRGLRLNPLKDHDPCCLLTLEEQIPWEKNGRYLSADSLAGSHILHKAGAWYIQEPSAMIPVAVLDPKPGEWILDMCAAPGGKSSQIGERMQGEGLLVSNEFVFQRAEQLSRTIEAAGIVNALVTSASPEKIGSKWPGLFDGVLVDAPCSGSGMFRKYPELIDTWESETPAGCARRQAAILSDAYVLVRPGGRLVYSTCSYDWRENEGQIEAFLLAHPEFELESFDVPGVDGKLGMTTVYPFQIRGEGHFVSLLRRKGTPEQAMDRRPYIQPSAGLDRASEKAWSELAPHAVLQPNGLQGEDLVWSPDVPDCKGIAVLRRGLRMAFRKGKVLVPHHAWAMSEKTAHLPVVPLDGEAALKYMAGEELPDPGEHSGFACVSFAGYHLGWVKASGDVLKNHLPKGLRITKGLVQQD